MLGSSYRPRLLRSAVALAIGAAAPAWSASITERVSLGPHGVEGNDGSGYPAISANGQFVTFLSRATNLVPDGSNGRLHVYVRNRKTGTTQRVSLSSAGVQANGSCDLAMISATGRFVAFDSRASNLVPSDTNGREDVFVRDRKLKTTERVSIGPHGVQGNGTSFFPAISADGRFVAFVSDASNLVPGDTNGTYDVFVHDRMVGTTERLSLGPGGVQRFASNDPVAISPDGRFVAFDSAADNLVPGDTNATSDVFVRDRKLKTTQRVSVGSSDTQGNDASFVEAISADGRHVVFDSVASNLVPSDTNGVSDIFVHDRQTGKTTRVSLGPAGIQGNGNSVGAAISADGRFVAFDSSASNLVPGDTNDAYDAFVRDRQTGTTRRASLGRSGVQAAGDSFMFSGAISADGRIVTFGSSAENLVPDDTNGVPDAFVRAMIP